MTGTFVIQDQLIQHYCTEHLLPVKFLHNDEDGNTHWQCTSTHAHEIIEQS